MFARMQRVIKRRRPKELAIVLGDRVLRRLGVSLLSYTRYGATPAPQGVSATERFDNIAENNSWGSSESLSGGGSELRMTARYREQLVRLLPRFRSMIDAPCGDMNWMPLVLGQIELEYLGGDISSRIVEQNRARYPHLKFKVFDITRDDFPDVDVWHCRDCLFHLAYGDIHSAVSNFLRSSIPYALITTHKGLVRNSDIESGGWRYLNLNRPPFSFPKPQKQLTDYLPGELPRVVGLWSREQLQLGVANLSAALQQDRAASAQPN